MRIILGTILICFVVPSIWIPECFSNGSWVASGLWVQKTLILVGQSAQNSTLCPTELLRQFFCHFTFICLWYLSNVILLISRNICVPCLVIPRMFLIIIPVDDCKLSFPSQSCHLQRKEKYSTVLMTELIISFYKKLGKMAYSIFRKNSYRLIASIQLLCAEYFHLSYFHFLLGGKPNFTCQVKVEIEKNTFFIDTLKWKCQLWQERNTFPSIFSLIGRVFTFIRQKIDAPDPSELDIKMLIPAPTYYLQTNTWIFDNWTK